MGITIDRCCGSEVAADGMDHVPAHDPFSLSRPIHSMYPRDKLCMSTSKYASENVFCVAPFIDG